MFLILNTGHGELKHIEIIISDNKIYIYIYFFFYEIWDPLKFCFWGIQGVSWVFRTLFVKLTNPPLTQVDDLSVVKSRQLQQVLVASHFMQCSPV